MSHATHPSAEVSSQRLLRQALLGAVFLGVVAMASLPAARGAGPLGWMPLWLLGMPLAGLAALGLADLRERLRAVPAAAAQVPARRRVRPAQARRRLGPRAGPSPRRVAAPAAA